MTTTERRIRSVRYSGATVEITGIDKTITESGFLDREWTVKCTDAPDPALPAALGELPPHVRDLIMVPSDWCDGDLEVLKVTWSYSETTEVKGATITCMAKLETATSPLTFNVPHLPFDQYSPGGAQPTMPTAVIRILTRLEHEVEQYLDGKRAQADLFDTPAPSGKDRAAGELVGA